MEIDRSQSFVSLPIEETVGGVNAPNSGALLPDFSVIFFGGDAVNHDGTFFFDFALLHGSTFLPTSHPIDAGTNELAVDRGSAF